jgi:hypothetical protein
MPIATTAKRLVILRVTDPDRLADAIDADLRPQTGIRRSAFAAVSSKLIRDPFDQLSDKVDDGPTSNQKFCRSRLVDAVPSISTNRGATSSCDEV